MSNEFDIEKAKRGEPVEFRSHSDTWIPVHYVGNLHGGAAVVEETQPAHEIHRVHYVMKKSELRMTPKKVKVRYRVGAYKDIETSEIKPFISSPHEDEVRWSGSKTFVEWLTEWQEAEVEQ